MLGGLLFRRLRWKGRGDGGRDNGLEEGSMERGEGKGGMLETEWWW